MSDWTACILLRCTVSKERFETDAALYHASIEPGTTVHVNVYGSGVALLARELQGIENGKIKILNRT